MPQEPEEVVVLRVLSRLVEEEDWRGVVRVVEHWAEKAELPRSARIIEAQAFLGLRLMDRAWLRLREVSDIDEDDVGALALTARMFIERGWPPRARKVLHRLEELRPDHPDLPALREDAAAAPRQPPPNAHDLEQSGTTDEVVKLAEIYLATGSIIRARGLLERVQRRTPGLERVDVLLWGIRGQFVTRGTTLEEVLDEVLPNDALSEWDAPDNTESMDFGDISMPDPETAEVATLPGMAGRRGEGAFPSLFRHPGDPLKEDTVPREDDEVTVSAVMASDEELINPPPEDPDAVDEDSDDPGDTQIMQVIPSGDGARLVPVVESFHKDKGDDALRQTLDLREWQQSMGMRPTAGPGQPEGGEPGDEGLLEDEDEDLVVMTRREAPPEEPTEPPTEPRRGPIEVIEKHPVPEVASEPAPTVTDEGPALDDPTEEISDDAVEDARVSRARSARRWNRLFIGLSLMALLIAGVGFMAIQFFAVAAGDDIVREVHRTLGDGNIKAIEELEANLDRQVDAGRIPVGVRAAELALVRAVLWTEFSGDPRDLEGAEDALAIAQDHTAPSQELALVRARLALTRGDLRSARLFADRAGLDTHEARRLAAELALAEGEPQAALDAWGRADTSSGGNRHAVLVPLLLAAAGHDDAADKRGQQLLRRSGDDVEVFLAAHEQGWAGGSSSEQVTALDRFYQERQNVLSARQKGRVHAARARLLAEQGKTEETLRAWQRAQAADPSHPTYLFLLGAEELLSGRATSGERLTSRCLELYPYNHDCTRGQVALLLDMDRVEPARQLVDKWNDAGLEPHPVEGWVLLAEDEFNEALTFARGALADEGEGERDTAARIERARSFYTLGIALGELVQDDPDLAAKALNKTWRTLSSSTDPLDHQLGLRALAARAFYSPEALSKSDLASVAEQADHDPVAEVFLARYYEKYGRSAAAAQHFKHAASIAPENGIALYWRGRYNYETRDDLDKAREAWQRYLDLGPSGVRADGVKATALFRTAGP